MDSAGELHVLWHDGDSLGVDGAEVGVLEKTNHVGLGSLLEGKDGGGLESELASVPLRWRRSSWRQPCVRCAFLGAWCRCACGRCAWCGFLTPPVEAVFLAAALCAMCFLGCLVPVCLRAVCLVRAIVFVFKTFSPK